MISINFSNITGSGSWHKYFNIERWGVHKYGLAVTAKTKGRITVQLDPPQPTSEKGLRYFDCPLYSDCLTKAVKRNWRTWSCALCPNVELEPVGQKARFVAAYYRLLSEIYPEFREKYKLAMSRYDWAV